MPSAAQLRARREFVRRFGHGGRMKKNHATGRRHRHRNPEGEHTQHHAAHKSGWIMPVVVIGGILFLMKSNAFAGMLGPGVGGGYTPVGTDATGHPIYSGPAGGPPPAGYTQTGVTASGQPIYQYSGGGVLGPLGTIVSAGGGLVNIIGRLFGGGSSVPSGGGGGITGSPLPGGGTSVTSPDILTGGGIGLPDISLPDLSSLLPDITLPDLNIGDLFGGAGGGGFDFGVPDLSLDLAPLPDIVPASFPDLSSVWGEF